MLKIKTDTNRQICLFPAPPHKAPAGVAVLRVEHDLASGTRSTETALGPQEIDRLIEALQEIRSRS